MTESKAGLPPLIIALLALAGALGPGPASAQNQSLHSVGPRTTHVRTLDPASGATLGAETIQLAGRTISGANALATHPLTGELFAILFDSTTKQRILATLDPATGIAKERAVTSGAPGVSALAFDSTGRLFTAFASNHPADLANKLFEIDTNTAGLTFFTDLGTSQGGNALAFNPNDGMLYHLSGTDSFGTTLIAVFEKINPATKARTAISASGDALQHVRAMTFAPSGHFLVTSGLHDSTINHLFRLTPGGVATRLATLDHQPKGLAFKAPNAAPVAADDAYGLRTNRTLSVAAGAGVLANDGDPEDDPLTAFQVEGPANGSLLLAADGSFTYDPDNGFSGPDSFTYKANDGALDSNLATVAITVAPINILSWLQLLLLDDDDGN